LLFIHVITAVRATAWLTVLNGTEPTFFDNDIDTGLRVWNRLKMFCLNNVSTFFTWWSHANIHIAKAGRYAYCAIKFTSWQILSSKETDLTGFYIIKPNHPDGLKKRSRWRKTALGALHNTPQHIHYDVNFPENFNSQGRSQRS